MIVCVYPDMKKKGQSEIGGEEFVGKICENNYYCDGQNGKTNCPLNSISGDGSTSLIDCAWNSSYFGPFGGPCKCLLTKNLPCK